MCFRKPGGKRAGSTPLNLEEHLHEVTVAKLKNEKAVQQAFLWPNWGSIKEEHTAVCLCSLSWLVALSVLIKQKCFFLCPGWPTLLHAVFRGGALLRATSLAFLVREPFCWKRQPTLPRSIKGRQGTGSSGVRWCVGMCLCGWVAADTNGCSARTY